MIKGQGVTIHEMSGENLHSKIPDIARLRIEIFKEYPYLYQGSTAYEEKYLKGLMEDPHALVVLAEDQGHVVGAATSIPLMGPADITQAADVPAMFALAAIDPRSVYYYSEILVLPDFRRSGIAAQFYARRQTFAANHGYTHVCFAAAVRPNDDPRKPVDYFSPEPMWRRMGFQPYKDMVFHYEWPTLQMDGGIRNEKHAMRFWIAPLPCAQGEPDLKKRR